MRERCQALKCALSAQRKSKGDRPRENLSHLCCYRVLITTRRLEVCVVVANGQETRRVSPMYLTPLKLSNSGSAGQSRNLNALL